VQPLTTQDQKFAASARGLRAAIIVPSLFAIGLLAIKQSEIAAFSVFGTFAHLVMANYSAGRRIGARRLRRRRPEQILVKVAAMLVVIGTSLLSSARQMQYDFSTIHSPIDSDSANSSSQPQQPVSSQSHSENPPTTTAERRKLNCAHPADPNKRRFGCKDERVDWEETMARDWQGLREEARDMGITPSASYYSALQTNTAGGSHQVWGYVGQLTTALDLNFDKLLRIPGMSLHVSNYWGTGSNLTAAIGSVFPVSTNYGVGSHLGEIYLQQKLAHGNLTVAAGRLAADYTFASLPVFDNYVSAGINSNPFSILTNDHSYVGPPPGLEWGAEAVYNVASDVQAAAGVFNTNQNSANNGNVFAFQQGNKGALVTAQVTYLRNQAARDHGKPGQYTAGYFEDNNAFPVLPLRTTHSDGNTGVFLLGQQMIYRPDSDGSTRGLTIWGAWTYSPKQSVSSMPVFGGGGFSYEGLIWRRKNDIVSVGYLYGTTSSFIPHASAAKLLEVNYQWVPTRYIAIVPDLQYLRRPAGTTAGVAAVFGIRMNVTF
jgi:porin